MGIIIGIALVAAVGGGVYYVATQGDVHLDVGASINTEDGEAVDTDADMEDSVNGQGSLESLLGLGRDLTCTFSRQEVDSQINGTVYVSGEDMRGDFDISSEASGNTESHMIMTGDRVYVWNEGSTQGTQFKASEEDSEQAQKFINLDQTLDYDCDSWRKDSSKFNLPPVVTFTDISGFMTDSGEADVQEDIDCSVCDQTPEGAARDSCLAALGC